jgi:hypothetical protein
MKEGAVDASVAAAQRAAVAALAGTQLEIAGKFLESELHKHGSVRSIPDTALARILAKAVVDDATDFPAAARKVAARLPDDKLRADVEAAAKRVDDLNASPGLKGKLPELKTLASENDLKMKKPDYGSISTSTGTTPPPEPNLPEPVDVQIPISVDQFPQETRDQAQAEWDAMMTPEHLRMLEEEAQGYISGGGSGGGAMNMVSGALTSAAIAASTTIGGPLGAALAALAAYLIPRMLEAFKDVIFTDTKEEQH